MGCYPSKAGPETEDGKAPSPPLPPPRSRPSSSTKPLPSPLSPSSFPPAHPLSDGPEALYPTSRSVLPFPVYPSFDREYLLQTFSTEPPREFTFSELVEATDNFDESVILGEGGFGKVYGGFIEERDSDNPLRVSRRQVAVKKLNQEGLQGFNEWLTEVIFLRRLHHPHLVHLVGYCTEGGEGLLVYEFMPNGSLDNKLFSPSEKPLSWEVRVKIALGAAKGLAYLHEGTDRQVIFRDLKAGNILLDHVGTLALADDYTAKLSDFGLAKDGPAGDKTHVSTKVVGTHGYTAPEYMSTGHLTAKSDVYAFGVVMLELLCGRRAVDMDRPTKEQSLVHWMRDRFEEKKGLSYIIDPNLEGRYPYRGALNFLDSAQCCLLDPRSRPTMCDMVQTLRAVQEYTVMDGYKYQERLVRTDS